MFIYDDDEFDEEDWNISLKTLYDKLNLIVDKGDDLDTILNETSIQWDNDSIKNIRKEAGSLVATYYPFLSYVVIPSEFPS